MTSFKQFLESKKAKKKTIEDFINKNGLILFFKHDNEIFAAPEDGRLVFARIKTPSEDEPSDELSFSACNLLKTIAGDHSERLFSHKDLNKIKIIDPERIYEFTV